MRSFLILLFICSGAFADYGKWRGDIGVADLHIVFASQHLNNPASSFGHTFLKINDKKAINFSAFTGDDYSIAGYIYNGIFGGYPGIYEVVSYKNLKDRYLFEENRNLIEYKLNLSENETENLLKQVWKSYETRKNYYFFDENCSSALIDLIDAAKGTDMSDSLGFIVIPADTVRILNDNKLIDESDIKFIPSLQSKMQKLPVQRPELGHKPHGLSLSAGRTDLKKSFVSLKGRLFLHDLLDDDYGYIKYSNMKIGEFEIDYLTDENKLILNKFTFVNVASYNKFSWEIDLNYGRFEINDKGFFNLNGAFGTRYKNYYLLLDNGLKVDENLLAFSGFKTGFFVFMGSIKSITEFKLNVFTDSDYSFYEVSEKFRYNINKNNGIELDLSYQKYFKQDMINKEISLNYIFLF